MVTSVDKGGGGGAEGAGADVPADAVGRLPGAAAAPPARAGRARWSGPGVGGGQQQPDTRMADRAAWARTCRSRRPLRAGGGPLGTALPPER